MKDADVFLGVSGSNLVNEEQVKSMAPNAVIFACSNPDPEVAPAVVQEVRPDIIFGTGRSDYPNQINNVICFPFLFRGALDVRASEINLEMKKAAMNAIRLLAQEPVPDEVLRLSGEDQLEFGKHYIMPKAVDHRLYSWVSKAVAKAAIASGVARKPMPAHYME
jgi:malate dehydrogenase (oxaloacetate-decarboxylating)(NADP+)